MSSNNNSNNGQTSSTPKYLSDKHLAEWCEGSGVPEAIVRRAVKSLNDRTVIKKHIGWKGYSEDYSLGWFVSGLNLKTMQPQVFGQFKPDIPIQFPEEDKPAKYITKKGEYDAIALPHPNKDFWQRVIDDPSIPVSPIEGPKKAGALLGLDFAALSICGVEMGLRKGKLVSNLEAVAVPGRPIPIVFDVDLLTKKEVRLALQKLATALKQKECIVTVALIPPELDCKGMDDVLVNHGPEMVKKIMANAIPYSQWLKSLESQFNSTAESRDTGNNKPPSNSKNKHLLDLIETHWGQRLRFNEMTQQVELNGKAGELNVERVYLRLAEELGVDIDKQKASDLVLQIAEKYAYSPVRDYLNSLANVSPINLDSLAKRYFGTDNPLHATFFKRTLIAAVARVFEPGCQVDTTLILQGTQGLFKSRCLQVLASDPWFTDNLSEGSNEKDEKMKLRYCWIVENSEFETVYKNKDISKLKAFLTSRYDCFRRPWGRSIENVPRTCIFFGTTNKQEILRDETGSRRFWVIPVQKTIPIKTVEAERDSVWAAAVVAYKNGEQWWLTPEEDNLLAETNKGWQSSDTWEVGIINYLEHKSETTIADLLLSVIKLDLAEQKRSEQMRVAEILCCNGWKKAPNPKRIDGKLQRYWEKVVTGSNGVVTEVVTPPNPLPDSITDIVLLPVTTFLPTLLEDSQSAEKNANSESQEKIEHKVVTPPPDNSQNPSVSALQPVTTPVTTSVTTSNAGARHKEFEKGDRVVIVEVGSLHEGQHGEVLYAEYGSRDIDYTIKLDKESRGNQRVKVTVPHTSKFVFLMTEKL